MTSLSIFTDGGARGNPGPAAIGIVLKNHSTGESKDMGLYIGVTTNNVAEYKAVIEGLKMARDVKANSIEFNIDSELVVRQLTGFYRVKEPHLTKLWLEIKGLEKSFGQVHYKHIPREMNKEADKLVNRVLDLQKPTHGPRTIQRTLV